MLKTFKFLVVAFILSVSSGAFAQLQSAQTEVKYPTVEMRSSSIETDRAKHVIYLSADQREEIRIVISDGLVYDHVGNPILNSFNKHQNHVNYVMDAAGNFYLFDEYTTPTVRHSSVFAAGPVAGAGDISIIDGHIVYLDSNSGHYPSKKVFENVLLELAAHGVDTSVLGSRQKSH
jgi:hypothetical protein